MAFGTDQKQVTDIDRFVDVNDATLIASQTGFGVLLVNIQARDQDHILLGQNFFNFAFLTFVFTDRDHDFVTRMHKHLYHTS
jgi:hypothetical protein